VTDDKSAAVHTGKGCSSNAPFFEYLRIFRPADKFLSVLGGQIIAPNLLQPV
jgi:hypothetical protein